MALQATVTQFQKPGARGLISHAESRNIISRSLAIGAAALAFGVPVYRAGTTADACTGDNTQGDLLGLSRRSGVIDPAAAGDQYVAGDEVPIMTEGTMWVETNGAVVLGVPANFDKSTKLWTANAVAGNVIAVPYVEFDTSTSAAGLAVVRFTRGTPA